MLQRMQAVWCQSPVVSVVVDGSGVGSSVVVTRASGSSEFAR